MRAWLEKKRQREKDFGKADDEPPDGPGCSLRFLILEAAKEFGCDGLRGFLSQPREWQAEMVAHQIIKAQREAYQAFQLKEWQRRRSKGKMVDPGAAQRREWMV